MKTIEEFIKNLSKEDIDLTDKLDNLYGHGQISETVYILASESKTFDIIEHYIDEILSDDIGESSLPEESINFIIKETQRLYDEKLILNEDDFASGLYNCDEIYLYAIADALDLDMYMLETYESEDK